MNRPVIGFAGMTHLGINSAAASLGHGFATVCFDGEPAVICRLQADDLPVVEPGLPELLAQHRERVEYTSDIERLGRCQVVYIAADVPTDDEGQSDLTGIEALIEKVSGALAPDAILVVLCQVPPGFTRRLPLSTERLYYQVETLVFGRAVERAMNPERFIVGCADPTKALPRPLAQFLGAFGCPILPMRYESAELAKISINCCLVASVTVANTLSELCESIGADWSEIAPALKLDRRIGPHAYLAPGLGLAGGNLERDLATVMRFSEHHGTDAGVVEAWIANSRHRRGWAAGTVREAVLKHKPDALVAVWGLAYKENTHSTKNSPSLATIAQLASARLRLHDPVVPAKAAGHARAEGVADPLAAVAGCDALMVLTPWPQYRDIPVAEVARVMAGRTLIDPYRVFDARAAVEAGLDYYTLGVPPIRARQEAAHA